MEKASWHVPKSSPSPEVLVLGTILEDPYDVHSPLLNPQSVISVPEKEIFVQTEEFSRRLVESISDIGGFSVAVKAWLPDFLTSHAISFAQAGSQGQRQREIVASNISASCFSPSRAYIDQCLQLSPVVDWIRRKKFAQDLYIVTGVAVAESITKREVNTSTNGAGGGAGVSTPQALPAAAGITASGVQETESIRSSDVEVKEKSVLSYRVRRFMYNKLTKKPKDKGNVTLGALYGADGKVSIAKYEHIPEFDDFVIDDEWAEDKLVVKLETRG